ncbi:MAG: cytochrome c biogenesis protein CcsA [Planctomycetes bacterium]|nr:cytochrome c biogenesis protein CcsA [Planctomycetota bacterium]
MFASVLAGVLCLTAGVLVGYMYARTVETASNAWRTDPKVILTTVTWLAYLLVALSSFLPAFRGRRAAQASVACFAFVILAFWATAFSSRFHGFR